MSKKKALPRAITLRGCGWQDAAVGEGSVGIDQRVVVVDPAAVEEVLVIEVVVETNEVLTEVEWIRRGRLE